MHTSNHYDVIVIGGGHAGCEAALAASGMGMKTLLITQDLDTIAQMSCNPSIGGLGKGQIVRELDALGGRMAKITDLSVLSAHMLNTSRGAAVSTTFNPADEISREFKKGIIGMQGGYSWYESMSLYDHTAGTWTGTDEVYGAGQSGSSLVITSTARDTVAVPTGSLAAAGAFASSPGVLLAPVD